MNKATRERQSSVGLRDSICLGYIRYGVEAGGGRGRSRPFPQSEYVTSISRRPLYATPEPHFKTVKNDDANS